MRQLTFLGPGLAEWREAAPPRLESDAAAIVRPLAVATCDMDAAALSGLVRFRGPTPLGHEAVAEVVDVGDAVTVVRPGDRVVVPWQISCGSCDRCRRGQSAYCGSVPAGACYGWGPHAATYGGMFADAVAVPFADHMLVPVPSHVSSAAAAGLADNVVDGWRAVAEPPCEPVGRSVLVVGGVTDWGGSIGLYAAQFAMAMRAERVVFASQAPGLLAKASALGAEAVRVTGAEYPALGHPFDITVDASGLADGLRFAVRSTDRHGVCTSTAGAVHRGHDVPLPVYDMYMRSLTFRTGWVSTRDWMHEPLRLVSAGQIDPLAGADPVSWDDLDEALAVPFTKIVATR